MDEQKRAGTPAQVDTCARSEVRGRRQRSGRRAKTESLKRSGRRRLVLLGAEYPERPGVDYQRPRTRGECAAGERPCPYVSCRYHLYLDVSPRTGSVKMNFPGLEPEDLAPSCALDVIDQRGDQTLESVAHHLNVTREAVRLIERKAGEKVRRAVETWGGPEVEEERLATWAEVLG